MKKAATLVAGLLLVTGTIFADGKISLTGTVELQTSVLKSSSDVLFEDGSNGDTDVDLAVTYEPAEGTTIKFEVNTDDDGIGANGDSNGDETLDVAVVKTIGDIEVGFDTEITDDAMTGLVIKEAADSSDTYVKWNMGEKKSLTVYPFNMETNSAADEFDEDGSYLQIPGIVYSMGDIYVGAGVVGVTDTENDAANVVALKAGYKSTMGDMKITAEYSGAIYDTDTVTENEYIQDRNLGLITHSLMATMAKPLTSALSLYGEAGYNMLANDIVDTDNGFGAYAKVTDKMSDVVSIYASVKYSTDGFLAYGDMRDLNLSGAETGGIAEATVGVDYTLVKGLVFTPEVSFKTAGEDIYTDSDNEAQATAYELTAQIAYSF